MASSPQVDEQGKKLQDPQQRSWFSKVGGVVRGSSKDSGQGDSAADDDEDTARKYTWRCKATFSLGKQEAVRDIRWNRLVPDTFGAVTASGNLVVYNMHVPFKALVKIAAHTGDASSLDFHPRKPFIATGGSADHCVKIWNLESSLDSIFSNNKNSKETHQYYHENANTWNTNRSELSTNGTSLNDSM